MDFKITVIFNNNYVQNCVILLTCVIYPKKSYQTGKMIKDPHL
jgi:NDP-sugar pyrophosphorylase family protein